MDRQFSSGGINAENGLSAPHDIKYRRTIFSQVADTNPKPTPVRTITRACDELIDFGVLGKNVIGSKICHEEVDNAHGTLCSIAMQSIIKAIRHDLSRYRDRGVGTGKQPLPLTVFGCRIPVVRQPFAIFSFNQGVISKH